MTAPLYILLGPGSIISSNILDLLSGWVKKEWNFPFSRGGGISDGHFIMTNFFAPSGLKIIFSWVTFFSKFFGIYNGENALFTKSPQK